MSHLSLFQFATELGHHPRPERIVPLVPPGAYRPARPAPPSGTPGRDRPPAVAPEVVGKLVGLYLRKTEKKNPPTKYFLKKYICIYIYIYIFFLEIYRYKFQKNVFFFENEKTFFHFEKNVFFENEKI